MVRILYIFSLYILGFPGGSDGKSSASNSGDLGSIPGSGRSPGEGNGNPLQDSCLENSMDGGAWWAIVHGVAKSWTIYRTLIRYIICTYFSHSVVVFSISWWCPLRHKVFNIDESSWPIFFFHHFCAFCVMSKKLLHNPRSRDLLLCVLKRVLLFI